MEKKIAVTLLPIVGIENKVKNVEVATTIISYIQKTNEDVLRTLLRCQQIPEIPPNFYSKSVT